MKKATRIFAAIFATAIMVMGADTASAEALPRETATTFASVEPRASAQLSRYSAYIVALGNGKMEVEVDVIGTHKPMIKVGIEELHIEYETSPGVWRDWGVYKNRYTEDSLTHYETIEFSGIVGRSYRVSVTVFAEDSSGRDTGTLVSGSTVAT